VLAPLGRRPCLCPARAPPPAPRAPNTFPPSAPAPVPPSLGSRSGQPLHPLLPPLAPHACPGALLSSGGTPRARADAVLPQGPQQPRAAHIQRCAILVLALGAQSQPFPGAGEAVGIRKAGKVARFGEQGMWWCTFWWWGFGR
jgi:hypothetical protein